MSLSDFLHSSRFFSFSCLGIYDLTGCNRQDKAIHHAGLMWESKFNLVSLIYKYWPFWEHTEHIYLSVKSRLYTMSNKFLRLREGLFSYKACREYYSGGRKRLCISLAPNSFDSILITVHFISVFIFIFVFKGQWKLTSSHLEIWEWVYPW